MYEIQNVITLLDYLIQRSHIGCLFVGMTRWLAATVVFAIYKFEM